MNGKTWKRLISYCLIFALIWGSAGNGMAVQASEASEGADKVQNLKTEPASLQQPFYVLSADELTEDMGAGWNLGNTMDGHTGFTPGETVWQHVKTTKKLIKKVHDLGFNTVRIPVTWGTMIHDEDYSIDEKWISRVQDIVDYCMSQNMYAIINTHHDDVAESGGWLDISSNDQEVLKEKFAGVWKTIATYFKDYDEHLIFESMNEVQGSGTVAQQNQKIMALNQVFVDTVRATGSNNEKRWLMVPGKYNFIDSICNKANGFAMPEDTVPDRIILSVHVYTPWEFCGQESKSKEKQYTYTTERLESNDKELQPLYEMYTSKGIPVVVGEYGCVNKDNPSERAFYLEGMNRLFHKYKLVGVYWDQGWYDRSQTPDYSFTIIDRNTGEPVEKEVTDALIRGQFSGEEDYTALVKDVSVDEMTEIQTGAEDITLAVGERKEVSATCLPETSNDILLWKSEDAAIASVYQGRITGRSIGDMTIVAFSQSGSVSKEITVHVEAEAAQVPCTDISLDQTEYSLEEEETAYIDSALSPSDTTGAVSFISEDDTVATVSAQGKIVAVGKGKTTISVCTSGGKKADVAVEVHEKAARQEIKLSINVYYADSAHSYFGNEVGSDVVTVSEDGQYTLTFDCSRDLSEAAGKAGVTDLNKVGAIYIKDYDVAEGNESDSPLATCLIHYDAIAINGQELQLKEHDAKSALKGQVFDTNDPINAYDGSVIQGEKQSGYSISFSDFEKPLQISITFTLSGISFGKVQETGPAARTPSAPENTETEQPLAQGTEQPEVPGAAGTEQPQAPASTVTPSSVSADVPSAAPPAKGTKLTDRKTGTVYQVTAAGSTVEIIKNKTIKKLDIPAKITMDGISYQVTSVAEGAFKGNTKLKNLTIGKNIEKIGKKAFYGCKNLKHITIKTKKLSQKKVGSDAFGGIPAKAAVKVPGTKWKVYRKLLKAKGLAEKTQKITK